MLSLLFYDAEYAYFATNLQIIGDPRKPYGYKNMIGGKAKDRKRQGKRS